MNLINNNPFNFNTSSFDIFNEHNDKALVKDRVKVEQIKKTLKYCNENNIPFEVIYGLAFDDASKINVKNLFIMLESNDVSFKNQIEYINRCLMNFFDLHGEKLDLVLNQFKKEKELFIKEMNLENINSYSMEYELSSIVGDPRNRLVLKCEHMFVLGESISFMDKNFNVYTGDVIKLHLLNCNLDSNDLIHTKQFVLSKEGYAGVCLPNMKRLTEEQVKLFK